MKAWPAEGPKLLWSWQGLGKGFASMSAAGGMIYTTGVEEKTGYVYAFDLAGKPVWKKSYGPGWTGSYPGSRTIPTIDGGRLYIMSGQGRIACYNAGTGDDIWSVDTAEKFGGVNLRWGIAESVLIDGKKVICTPGGPDATVVALDKMTGSTIWTSKGLSEKSGYCSPILVEEGGNRLLITMVEKSIVCLEIETGKPVWRIPHEAKYDIQAVSPVYKDGMLYVTNSYNKGGYMFRLTDSGTKYEEKWHDPVLECHHGGVINIGNSIYGSNSREWVCLDLPTGKVKYTETLVGKGSAIYVGGLFYLYGENGKMSLVKATPTGFETISSFEITLGDDKHWAHPVVSNGVLYVRHGDTIMAFDIREK
jgi:outer membrane protein assembly factor BamB